MGLLWEIIKASAELNEEKENKEKAKKLKECKDSELEDWQTDLVMKGEYDTRNFEEEDLEDDDYYNEDDK